MKKLSIIVPVYNAEKYIERCVNSLLNQTYQNVEVILVNDGSKDGSLAICSELAGKDGRIKVFDKENGGAASARNVGIREATGDYIGFCDSDDYFDPEMMTELVNVLEAEALNTIECTSRVLTADGQILNEDSASGELVKYDTKSAIEEIYFRRGSVSLATRLTRAEFIKQVTIPEGRRVEDFYFTISLLLKTGGTAVLNRPFYNCVATTGSVTRSPGGSIYLDALYFYQKANELLAECDIDISIAQEYYRLKMYYLLAISTTATERKRFKAEISKCKADAKSRRRAIINCKFLKKKEKLVLMIATVSFGLARLMYKLKGGK